MTRWLNPAPVEVPASFADLNLHPLIAQTLVRRGITTLEAARAFLHPDSPARAGYERLAALFHSLRGAAPEPWDTLSMGMSADYAQAIAEGSTMVRIGTALFGRRGG